jgi:hypothetical protein
MVQIFAECYLRECKVVMFRTLSEWYQEFVRERKMFFLRDVSCKCSRAGVFVIYYIR